MKLNINAKELVALHNVLHEKFSSTRGLDYSPDDPRVADETQLRQVYNRLRACLIAALTNRQVDPVDAYLTREQAKIDQLKVQNDDIKKEQEDLAATMKDHDFFIPVAGDDYEAPDYPRRAPRNRGGNRGGNKR